MRKAVLCLVPGLVASLFFACDNSSGGGGGGQFTFDGGQFDAPVPILPDGDVPDVAAGPLPVTVKVNNFTAPVPNVEVVWHDATGAVIGTTKTDANGLAVSSGPVPAMATALLGSAASETHAVTWTGVAAGDVLLANAADITGVTTGNYNATMNQTDIVGSTGYWLTAGPNCDIGGFSPTLNQAYEIPLIGVCGATPGAVLAASQDDANQINGFSFVKNLMPVYDAGTVNATTGAWSAPTNVTLTVSNLPEAGAPPQVFFTQIAGAVPFPYFFPGLFVQPTLDTNGQATFLAANGFADAYQFGFVETDIRMGSYSKRIVGKRAAPAAAVGVDYKDLLPEILTATFDQSASAARPTIGWTSTAPLTTTDGGSISFTWHAVGKDFASGWTIIVPPDATSVKIPALPADATAWAPPDPDAGTLVQPIGLPTVMFAESDSLPGYADFRKIAGIAAPPPNKPYVDLIREVILPANGKLRLTDVENGPN